MNPPPGFRFDRRLSAPVARMPPRHHQSGASSSGRSRSPSSRSPSVPSSVWGVFSAPAPARARTGTNRRWPPSPRPRSAAGSRTRRRSRHRGPIWRSMQPSPASSLDTASWTPCFWYALKGAGCTHLGGYPEQEWYLPSQDQVYDGALHLVASPVSFTGTNAQGQPQIYPCRSGMVTTDSSFAFTYGYIQVVAQLPKRTNMWPALWMLPAEQRGGPPGDRPDGDHRHRDDAAAS